MYYVIICCVSGIYSMRTSVLQSLISIHCSLLITSYAMCLQIRVAINIYCCQLIQTITINMRHFI